MVAAVKSREIYSSLKAVPPAIVRCDGRGFSESLKRLGFEKPYDLGFERAMVHAATALMKNSGMAPVWAFTFSDEVSVLFSVLPFEGRVEKLDSVVASYIASAFTSALKLESPVAFDARVIPLHPEELAPYLAMRQAEAWRNHMQSYGFYALVKEGVAETEAAARMKGMKSEDIHEMMWRRGVNLGETPGWQRKGVFVYRREKATEGFDPVRKEKVMAVRSEITELWDPPLFSSKEGMELLKIAHLA